MLRKKLFNFGFILLQQLGTLPFKLRLDGLELVLVVSAHVDELSFHGPDQVVDVVVHELHLLYVVLILCLYGFLKLVFQLLFVSNDLVALHNLLLNVLVQLLAIFFLLKFLPVPVDFDILLVGGNDLILNLVGSFSL